MSKTIRSSKSFSGRTLRTVEEAAESSKVYSYSNLCQDHFRNATTLTQFSRKEDLAQPLLKHTPDEEKHVVVKIWKTLVRFITETQDSESNNSTKLPQLCQRNASVISRLSRAASEIGNESQTEDKQPSETGSNLSTTTWNTIRLKQLKVKLQNGLKRSSKINLYDNTSLEDSLSTPFEQIQYIVGWGLMKPSLRDEIYCMILRQLTNNPQKFGRYRGWVLLKLVVGIFLPSDKIFLYVARFIDEGPASFSSELKKLFVHLITDGQRHQPPSHVEYLAAVERKPVELHVTLMDGSIHPVAAVDSLTTSSEIISNISKAIELKEKFGFCLFIAMQNKVTSLGNEGDMVFDSISQCEQMFRNQTSLPEADAPWRLFVRKEMFSPWDDISYDAVATRLVYAQVTRGVLLGEYLCDTDTELATLAAKQYYCEFENDVSERGLINTLPSYLPQKKLHDDAKQRNYWTKQVVDSYRKLFNFSGDIELRPRVDTVKAEVIDWAKNKWTPQFSRYFDVILLEGPKGDSDVIDASLTMTINSKGVNLMTSKGRTLIQFAFWQIKSVSGEGQDLTLRSITGNVLIIVLFNGTTMKFQMVDANDIYRLITYSINGLKERSLWAIVTRDFDGEQTKSYLTACEGDLLRLERPAKQEAMTSLIAACTNMATVESGRLPTELLHVIASLEDPGEEILNILRSPGYHLKKSNCQVDDAGTKVSDAGTKVNDAGTK